MGLAYGLRFSSSFGTFAGSGRNYVLCVCLCCCVLCLGKGVGIHMGDSRNPAWVPIMHDYTSSSSYVVTIYG